MGKSSLLIWCGNLILQKDLHHVYLILRNLLYLIANKIHSKNISGSINCLSADEDNY